MRVLLVIAGVVTMLVGVRLALRVRRWSPRITPDFSDYEPGPDVLDWARAIAPIVAGVTLLVVAVGA